MHAISPSLHSSAATVGHVITAVNGQPVSNKKFSDGSNVLEYLTKPENYPVSLRFSHVKAMINEKLMLLSMFHS